jgi:hypothetical protein
VIRNPAIGACERHYDQKTGGAITEGIDGKDGCRTTTILFMSTSRDKINQPNIAASK